MYWDKVKKIRQKLKNTPNLKLRQSIQLCNPEHWFRHQYHPIYEWYHRSHSGIRINASAWANPIPERSCLSSQRNRARDLFTSRKIRYHCVPGIMKDQGPAPIHHSALNRKAPPSPLGLLRSTTRTSHEMLADQKESEWMEHGRAVDFNLGKKGCGLRHPGSPLSEKKSVGHERFGDSNTRIRTPHSVKNTLGSSKHASNKFRVGWIGKFCIIRDTTSMMGNSCENMVSSKEKFLPQFKWLLRIYLKIMETIISLLNSM